MLGGEASSADEQYKQQEPITSNKKLIISIDYDGCYGHGKVAKAFHLAKKQEGLITPDKHDYSEQASTTRTRINAILKTILIQCNTELIDQFCEEIITKGYQAADFYVFSARQDAECDEYNARRNDNGCCFTAVTFLVEEVRERILKKIEQNNCDPDTTPQVYPLFMPDINIGTFLLADSVSRKKAGSSWHEATTQYQLENALVKSQPSLWQYDFSKFTICYGDSQHAKNANWMFDQINFWFIDDLWNPEYTEDFDEDIAQNVDILQNLDNFYRNHREFMPAGVSMQFHHYNGAHMDVTHPIGTAIAGTGMTDKNYYNRLAQMNNMTGSDQSSVRDVLKTLIKKPIYLKALLQACVDDANDGEEDREVDIISLSEDDSDDEIFEFLIENSSDTEDSLSEYDSDTECVLSNELIDETAQHISYQVSNADDNAEWVWLDKNSQSEPISTPALFDDEFDYTGTPTSDLQSYGTPPSDVAILKCQDVPSIKDNVMRTLFGNSVKKIPNIIVDYWKGYDPSV